MTYKTKKLEMDFGLGTRTRRWEYRGFIIKAQHSLYTPKIVNWSVQEPDWYEWRQKQDGYEWHAKTRKQAIEMIDMMCDRGN